MVRIIFVCTGNICRSPTAEGVFRKLVADAGLSASIAIASAGTHGYHVGEAPDVRSQQHASRRGYDLSAQRARAIAPKDFEQFDLVLSMDSANLEWLEEKCPGEYRHKLRRLMEFATRHDYPVVPDPYYGGPAGFDRVLDYIEDAAAGLLSHLRGLASEKPLAALRNFPVQT